MVPRIITRTHYQVDEPAYLRVLVRDCSTPTSSDYAERLARRLTDRLKALGKDFNLAAAKYCVDLGKGLGLLTDNNFWTWSAHVLQLISAKELEVSLSLDLSLHEKIFFFRHFLEHDGAAFVFLGRKVSLVKKLPEHQKDWNDIANEMMDSVYKSYLDIATDIQDRAGIRLLLAKRTRHPYAGKSGAHQCFVHLKTMSRIGLLESDGREYFKQAAFKASVDRFLEVVPDIRSLENVILKKEWPRVASFMFSNDHEKRSAWRDDEILDYARNIYLRVRATGASLCPLNSVIEVIQIEQIVKSVEPLSHEELTVIFRQAQAKAPTKIKFQVDRMGRPAFISFS
jgi:hypothetical protein